MDEDFLIGTGIYDITGPAADAGILSTAHIEQKTDGIHFRLYSRAFIIKGQLSGNITTIVVADLWSCTQSVKTEVVKRLNIRFSGNLFKTENILISGTHTHSGPGGYSHYALYNLSILGFDKQNFEVIVNGIVESVNRAYNNLSPGKIYIGKGKIEDCGWNRSLEAYLNNPKEERAKYDGEVDKEILVLKFEKNDGKCVGSLAWNAVHPSYTAEGNKLISGDNKGYAEYLFEQQMGSNPLNNDAFTAAFANSNCGDISGNVNSGIPDSDSDFTYMYQLGKKQYLAAKDLFNSAEEELRGSIEVRHKHINLSNTKIEGTSERTFPAALGISIFTGRTESGIQPVGMKERIDIKNDGDLSLVTQRFVSAVLKLFSTFIKNFSYPDYLSEELINGHGNKTIIIAPGISDPYPLVPEILPVQIIRIGSLAVLSIPGEITTMAGRRLREAILNLLKPIGVKYIAISAYANAYAGYITTREEYDKQNYEGASTLFGPYTFDAYRQEFGKLAISMIDNTEIAPGPMPRDLSNQQFTIRTGVMMDTPPWPNHKFGSLHTDVNAFYRNGETVKVVFWGAHPKNNLRTQDTFLTVEKKGSDGWQSIYTDRDPCTIYRWAREFAASSLISITWKMDEDVEPGEYRICHFGDWKSQSGKISPYDGISGTFLVGENLEPNDIIIRSMYDNQVEIKFFHPGDRLRLIASKSYTLTPHEIFTWTIPSEWNEVQVIFNFINQRYFITGRSIITIKKNGYIQIEKGGSGT